MSIRIRSGRRLATAAIASSPFSEIPRDDARTWFGVGAPKAMPAEIVEKTSTTHSSKDHGQRCRCPIPKIA
jgi:hypothetical protein